MTLRGKTQKQLEICIGGYSEAGVREINQDAFAVKNPNSYAEKKYKGIVATLADGISCSSNGQQASHTSVTQFINDYYCTPESWSVKHSANKVLTSLNSWLYRHSSQDNLRHNGFITTFSSIIFKSTSAYLFHVGDSRIYRYRAGKLKQLSHDHARSFYVQNSVLTRALGMDCNLEIDYQRLSLRQGDMFLLSSDGVHDFLADKKLLSYLDNVNEKVNAKQLEMTAKAICKSALAEKSTDNLSCLLLHITSLPDSDINELFNKLSLLTIPPALVAGNKIDSFEINKIVHQGARSHVYLATEKQSNKQFILKIPSLNFADDSSYLDGFCKEQWVGQKLNHPSIMVVKPRLVDSPFLYHICEYVQGISLRQWMTDNPHPPVEQAVRIIKKVVAAVRIFQRAGIVHRDLKPENIMIFNNELITLIDFGTVQIDGLDEISTASSATIPVGAVDYIAPEYLNKNQATSASDLFSIAVITYELLCGQLPYLPTSSQSLKQARSSLWKYRSIKLFRDDLPERLNLVLKKATQSLPDKRYSAMSEFVSELSDADKNSVITQFSLIEKDPLKFWQSLALLFFVAAVIEFFLLMT